MTYMTPLLSPIKPARLTYAIREVTSYWDRRRFNGFPRQHYRDDPHWAPPIAGSQGAWSRDQGPEGVEAAFFVAESPSMVSGDQVIGTIAAVINHRTNELTGENVGFFASFETPNRPEVAAALLDAAETWIAQRLAGVEAIRGPVALDPREAPGILVDGFDAPPAVFMPYHPPYYAEILESAGYEPAAEWVAYRMDLTAAPDLASGLGRVRAALGKTFEVSETSKVSGHAPPTDAALAQTLAGLARWLEPDLCCLAEEDGEPTALCLVLRDVNPARRRLVEGPFPLGWLAYQVARRRTDGVRLLPAWIGPQVRGRGGVTPPLLERWVTIEALAAAARRGYRYAEISPVATDDRARNEMLQSLGARVAKRYRSYEKRLGSGAQDP